MLTQKQLRRGFLVSFALMLLMILWGMVEGCTKNYKPHPNSIDTFDSQCYDALTIAQASLDEAKSELAQGKLPADAKAVINSAGGVYNLLRDAWLGYRAVKKANPSDSATQYVQQINALLPQLNRFIDDLNNLLGKKPKAATAGVNCDEDAAGKRNAFVAAMLTAMFAVGVGVLLGAN